jgi:hypothetical protein
MAYVMVSRETIVRADELRKSMLEEAFNLAAGRSCQERFNEVWHEFIICCDQHQPAGDLSEFTKRRLRNFYPVHESEFDGIISVTYRHRSLPKRKAVKVSDVSGRHPAGFTLEDVSGRDLLVDVSRLKYVSGITKGPFHITIEWHPKPAAATGCK